jgi:hypothetical protein
MSTIIRRKRTPRTLSVYKAAELLSGEIFYAAQGYYEGYGEIGKSRNVADFVDDRMRADWLANCDWLIEFWRSGKSLRELFSECPPWLNASCTRGTLPWAAEQFEVHGSTRHSKSIRSQSLSEKTSEKKI